MLHEAQAKLDAMFQADTRPIGVLNQVLQIHHLLGNASEIEQRSPRLMQRLASEQLNPGWQLDA